MELSTVNEAFDARLQKFVEGAQAKVNKHWEDQQLTYAQPELIQAEYAPKYVRVWKVERDLAGNIVQYEHKGETRVSRSIYVFIDRTTGNILKAATWKAPVTNNPRGNIMTDADYGLHGVTHHGAIYLR